MALSYGVERPTTGFGGDVQYTTPVLGDTRLPEAEPEFTSFLPSTEEIRKRKLQDEMMLNEKQRLQDFWQMLQAQRDPLGLMEQAGGVLPMGDPEQWTDIIMQTQSPDAGFGLGLNDFSGRAGMQGFSGLNMGGMFR
jgi:hypothetical protein